MKNFDKVLSIIDESGLSKTDITLLFTWYHICVLGNDNIDAKIINQYFIDASLPPHNITRLKNYLKSDKAYVKNGKLDCYKLSRFTQNELSEKYSSYFENSPKRFSESIDIYSIPFLTEMDINAANKMAEMYVTLYCLENSVRKFIEKTLSKNLGENWWESIKSSDLERKFKERKNKEERNRWLSPRGIVSPLFYLDWGDLVKIIRKREDLFSNYCSLKFLELRLEELENTRNIIAHNGCLPDDSSEFDRVKLYISDWCKQVQP